MLMLGDSDYVVCVSVCFHLILPGLVLRAHVRSSSFFFHLLPGLVKLLGCTLSSLLFDLV